MLFALCIDWLSSYHHRCRIFICFIIPRQYSFRCCIVFSSCPLIFPIHIIWKHLTICCTMHLMRFHKYYSNKERKRTRRRISYWASLKCEFIEWKMIWLGTRSTSTTPWTSVLCKHANQMDLMLCILISILFWLVGGWSCYCDPNSISIFTSLKIGFWWKRKNVNVRQRIETNKLVSNKR